MEKKMYLKPDTKTISMKGDRIMVNISNTEIDDDFELGAKKGFYEEDAYSLPSQRNIWREEE